MEDESCKTCACRTESQKVFPSDADVVEVVRCKDCKWYDTDGEEMNTQGHCWYKNGDPVMQDMKPNDYCSYGERKEQEEE